MKVLKQAFIKTIPVLCGYLFVGAAFGLLLQRAGYNYIWAVLSSVLVYAGSMQYVMIDLLTSGAGLVSAAFTTLAVNSRHLFYGLTFVERFRKLGWKKWYLIFALTDETYSLLCAESKEEAHGNFYLLVSLLNQIYWIIGSLVGSLLGEVIRFELDGIEFSMTALFVVILTEKWLATKSKFAIFIGLGCGMVWLFLLGSERFLLPSLVCATGILMLCKHKSTTGCENGGGADGH